MVALPRLMRGGEESCFTVKQFLFCFTVKQIANCFTVKQTVT
jgi:hypothetical protein